MQACLDTLAELLQDESATSKPEMSRRPSRLTAEQVEVWSRVVENTR